MVQTEYHHPGLHQQKSKVQLKLWSDSQKRSAKHHSVCTSGGCQQLTDDRSVMKLCLHQPAGSSQSIVFQTSPDFPGFFEYYFLGQLPGSPLRRRKLQLPNSCTAHQYLPKGENQDMGLIRTCNKPRVLDAQFFTPRCFIVMKHTGRHRVAKPCSAIWPEMLRGMCCSSEP